MKLLRFGVLSNFCLGMVSSGLGAAYTTDPISDAFVATGPTGNLSANNYGGGGALAVAAPGLPQGEFQTVMEFDLSGALGSLNAQYGAGQWSIQSVSLQLTASAHGNSIYNAVAPGLFGVSLMQNNAWVEGTGTASSPSAIGINYNTLVNLLINNSADQGLGTFSFDGATAGASTYSLDLSPGLTAGILTGGDVSLRLFAADNTVSYLFSSRSATPVSSEPELIITAVPEPGAMALFGMGLSLGLLARRRSRRSETESRGIRRAAHGSAIEFIVAGCEAEHPRRLLARGVSHFTVSGDLVEAPLYAHHREG